MTIRELKTYAAYRSNADEHERLSLLENHRVSVLARLAETNRHLAALDAKIAVYKDSLRSTGHGT